MSWTSQRGNILIGANRVGHVLNVQDCVALEFVFWGNALFFMRLSGL